MDDKILIFEDLDQDGDADKCIVFAGGLHQPTGFELGNGGAYIAEQPDILFMKDTNGDDMADTKVRKLFGFDSADSHHGIAAFEWGPGGNLYFEEGTFKYSQVESHWLDTLERSRNPTPRVKSSEYLSILLLQIHGAMSLITGDRISSVMLHRATATGLHR